MLDERRQVRGLTDIKREPRAPTYLKGATAGDWVFLMVEEPKPVTIDVNLKIGDEAGVKKAQIAGED